MAELYIIRHGSTELNSEHKARGWIDVPLDEHGKEEARKLAPKVKKDGVQIIVSSDLDRAKETAHIIASATGIPFKGSDKALRTWNIGIYSGKKSSDSRKILEDLAEKHPDKKIDKGESFNEFKNRLIDGIKKIDKKYGSKKVALVTHHSSARMYEAWKAKGYPDNNEVDITVYNAKGLEPGTMSK